MALFPSSPWPCSTLASRHCVLGLRLAYINVVQNIYIPLCVHGLRRSVCVNSPLAGLGLTGLPCVILIAVFWSLLFCLVLCLSRQLGLSAAPAGIRTFPWKSGFCAYGKSCFRLAENFCCFCCVAPCWAWVEWKYSWEFLLSVAKIPVV